MESSHRFFLLVTPAAMHQGSYRDGTCTSLSLVVLLTVQLSSKGAHSREGKERSNPRENDHCSFPPRWSRFRVPYVQHAAPAEMGFFTTLLSDKTWTVPLPAIVDGTLVIAWSFVILAYFLHPAIETAYHR